MPRAKATDGISAEAQAVLAAGFAAGRPSAFIAQAVLDTTGETVSERTVGRRAAEWRESKARFERAKEQYAAMKAAGMDGGQMIEALAFERLLNDPDALTGSEPIEFHKLGLEAEKIALKKREIAVRERVVDLETKKVALLEARERRAIAVLAGEDKGAAMTDEERVAAIREIYGIRS
jgi:hypothetical protein